jgi:murein DD-endopeptidase MepM/ murein hydrolase activator NlpD
MRPADATTGSGVAGSEFGPTRFNPDGSPKNHNGFDWSAPVGTAVRAPANATVTYGYDSKSGHYARFNLGNGATVSVAHMQKPDGIQNGQRVSAGTVVGNVGTSGNSAGSGREPHGHVVTRVDGESCNPRDFFSPQGGGGSCQ